MDASKMQAFSYSGYAGCGHPQDLLNEVATGLAAVRQAIQGFDLDFTPSPQAVTGIRNILEGLIATLEGVDPLFEEWVEKRYNAGFDDGAAAARRFPDTPIEALRDRRNQQSPDDARWQLPSGQVYPGPPGKQDDDLAE